MPSKSQCKNKISHINIPAKSVTYKNSSIFKPSVQFSLPQKTNIKNLHDFIKKQALMFKHKEKMLIKMERRENSNRLVQHLQEKIIHMLRNKTKEQISSEKEQSVTRQRRFTQVVELPLPPALDKQLNKRPSFLSKVQSSDKPLKRRISKRQIKPIPPAQVRMLHFKPILSKKSVRKEFSVIQSPVKVEESAEEREKLLEKCPIKVNQITLSHS